MMNVNVDAIVSPKCLFMLLCCKTFTHLLFGLVLLTMMMFNMLVDSYMVIVETIPQITFLS
jgi:hypothetical protein